MFAFDKLFFRRHRSCACCGGFQDEMKSTNWTARGWEKIYKCFEESPKEPFHFQGEKLYKCKACGSLWRYERWCVGHMDFDWKLTILSESPTQPRR